MMQYNFINLEGVLSTNIRYSHVFNNTRYYGAVLKVPRSVDRSDYINLFIPESTFSDLDLSKGDKIAVKGNLVQTFVSKVKNVSVLVKNITMDSEGSSYSNSGELKGEVLRSYDLIELSRIDKQVKPLLIKCYPDNSERSVILKCSAWNKLAEFIDSEYKQGDTIHVKYKLESKKHITGDDKSVDRVEGVILSVYHD